MADLDYNSQIENVAKLMEQDKVSPDEQDPQKFEKYHEYAKQNYNMNDDAAVQLIYEALLYLKLKNSDSADPMQDGDKFGVGFS
ncbi:hypothetical protein C6988_09595 [Nitrosopumilus sp. b1]|uniref:hypothetical protein n=1 Tax=Nitrosopumilus sp. b1 TaxID=2109907 RepID=UPI0015F6735D|nr:hypothetical protein [Nitrosopumilus sp. b1]KAF6242215.1 hypothetical protein C6988_09595 [Nitrosopumilus sp. b1]